MTAVAIKAGEYDALNKAHRVRPPRGSQGTEFAEQLKAQTSLQSGRWSTEKVVRLRSDDFAGGNPALAPAAAKQTALTSGNSSSADSYRAGRGQVTTLAPE